MVWWIVLLAAMALIGYLLRAFARQVDEIEDDARYMYEQRQPAAYGSKFLNILTGRDDGRGVYPARSGRKPKR